MDLELLVLSATTASEIDTAFATLVQRSVDGLVMGALAARYRLSTIYEWSEFVRAGGLVCYSRSGVTWEST